MKKAIFLSLLALGLSGCDGCGFQTMGSSETGVIFSALPPFLGGGVRNKIISPSEKEFVWPWETLIRVDTGVQSISWGGVGEGDKEDVEDFVQTRALDGNEVKLAMTVRYRVIPEKVSYVVQNVGMTESRVQQVVSSLAVADIRTHMNILKTEDFFNRTQLQTAVDQVRDALNARLIPEGIRIESVLYDSHVFARKRPDKTLDTSYQDQINETERTKQKTEQERNRNRTVEEEMKREYAQAEGEYQRVKEDADGKLRQAKERGDAQFAALEKDAERIYAVGMAEAEGMRKQIEALSGPGGKSLLRLEIVKSLLFSSPKFVVLNSESNSSGLAVNRVDTNDLIQQLGVLSTTGSEARHPDAKPAGDILFANPTAAHPPLPHAHEGQRSDTKGN